MRLSAIARSTLAATALAVAAVNCSQQPISVPVRSLEQSGRAAFVCLVPGTSDPGAPIDNCTINSPTYGFHHLFSLVTQTARGEIAVIDMTDGDVLDLDPGQPGYNFLPVGAQPADIVATPGGKVAFVGSGEPNKYAIYVLPLSKVLSLSPHLTDFAACALPSAPGRMLMMTQPVGSDGIQRNCAGEPLDGVDHPNGNLGEETIPPGTRKLLVALPDQGDLAVLDAQELLDAPAGSFGACHIERLIHLKVDLPTTLPIQRTPEGGFPPGQDEMGGVCRATEASTASPQSGFKPHPLNLAQDPETGLVYVADDAAPVIHVVDLADPCAPVERPPLLPMTVTDLGRTVFTRDLAVSPTTTKGQKFLYAVDHREGSMMVFDVSAGSSDRTPLLRPYPDRNPFQPRDRLSFAYPVKTVVFLKYDPFPLSDPVTGVAAAGVLCDPDANSVSLGASYRTASDYSSGAGPTVLRGIFAAAVLTDGQVVFIDVDDFDAPCRRPKTKGWCSNETSPNYDGASGELSCRVIEPHEARDAYYLATSDVTGARMPGMQSFPNLAQSSTTLPFDDTHPKMLAPRLPEEPGIVKTVQVGSRPAEGELSDPLTAQHNMVWFDLREPRAHLDQDWTIAYEGVIPGFTGHVLRLRVAAEGERGVAEDSSAYFCDRGVHDFEAAVQAANALGLSGTSKEPGSQAYQWALTHSDVLQIVEGILRAEDPYWASVADQCSYQKCLSLFGANDITPLKSSREFPIVEAYQNRVVVSDTFSQARCCFPMLTSYTVRGRKQWIVTGSYSGFLHKGTTDPDTGRCVDSCDPSLRSRNGRAVEWPVHIHEAKEGVTPKIPSVDDPRVFRNPVFQFWIHPRHSIGQAQEPTTEDPVNAEAIHHQSSDRDMAFSLTTTGGFFPLSVNLAASTTYVQPQSATYLPQFRQIAVADGSVQGLMMVDIPSLSLTASFY